MVRAVFSPSLEFEILSRISEYFLAYLVNCPEFYSEIRDCLKVEPAKTRQPPFGLSDDAHHVVHDLVVVVAKKVKKTVSFSIRYLQIITS